MKKKQFVPDEVKSYFWEEKLTLCIVTVSGLIYNLGLLAGPYFEGQMTGCLVDIFNHVSTYSDMLKLVVLYVLSIGVVQGSRYIKRFYVRRFANNVNRRMKGILYANLIRKSKPVLEEEGVGNIMTKAILDVDDCVEGMRKFTTEIFDTGVALIAYACMLLWYDYKLALLCMLFPPISYFIAERMKVVVQRTGSNYKKASGKLSAETLDRASNAITYRVFGQEEARNKAYENNLDDYERTAIHANIWSSALPPIYKVISLTGVIMILYFGSKNVLGISWTVWEISSFTTFLACFNKLATKSSSAAKLFNAVHKAQVSWRRIKPLLKDTKPIEEYKVQPTKELCINDLSFAYPNNETIFEHVSFTVKPNTFIGITGPVACGKSTLGKVFLCEYPYLGSIIYGNQELNEISDEERSSIIGYLGHDPELFNETIENNILLGKEDDVNNYLKAVEFDGEVNEMEQGIQTVVGSSGIRLSGGQAERLALARTLCHKRPIMILDDPFSALDKQTEEKVFSNIKEMTKGDSVFIISHRLYLFPKLDKIIWMNKGEVKIGTHEELMHTVKEYRELYLEQCGERKESYEE